MKDKLLQIRVDDEFLSKIEYLRNVNMCQTVAETIRKAIEKEYNTAKEEQKTSEYWKHLVDRLRMTSDEYSILDDRCVLLAEAADEIEQLSRGITRLHNRIQQSSPRN